MDATGDRNALPPGGGGEQPAGREEPSPAQQDDPDPQPAPKPPVTLAPIPAELTLKGRTITVRATIRIRGRAACRGKVTAVTGSGKQRATGRLTLRPVLRSGIRTCVAGGTIRLRRAPTAKTIKVRISGPKITTRTITAKR